MIDTLPENVNLFENSFLINWKINNGKIICEFKNGILKTKKIIFATNGFLKSLNIKKRYNFSINFNCKYDKAFK
jgi:hypothetical protein